MGSAHTHYSPGQNERSLWIVLGLTFTFMLAELAGGILTGSLALISDAAHMFTDAAALAIALAAVRIARRPADMRRSFGYHRFEIIAAAFNALLLFAVAIYIVYEAWQRLEHPPQIQPLGMLAIAAAGLVVNLIGMRLLAHGKEHSLNMRGAYLEVWSDMLGSIGVITGALLIHFTGWVWVDSVVAVGIGLWVVPRTWTLLKESLHILLEGVPEGIELDKLRTAIGSVPGVKSIHDLHVWSLTSGKVSLTVHVVYDRAASTELILQEVRKRLAQQFGVTHITVQCEVTPCDQTNAEYHFPGSEQTASSAHSHHRH